MLAEQTLHIGICRLSSLGDVALSTACLDWLAQMDRPLRVYWVGMPPHNTLLTYSPIELEHITIDPQAKWRSILQAVRELQHLHLFVDLQKNLRTQVLAALLSWRWNIPCCTYDKERLWRLLLILAARWRGRRKPASPHIFSPRSLQYARMQATLAEALQVKNVTACPRLVINAAAERYGRLAVAVGASYATKRAPLTLLVEVLQQVVACYDGILSICVLGNAQERELGEQLCIELALPSAQVENLCGHLSLIEVPQRLASMAVLLCNDSGLLHVAEAVSTPVVALFGPTVEAYGFKPWRANSRVFSSRLGCRPCSRHGHTPCRYDDKKCFTMLDSKAITAAVLQHL